MSFITRLVKGAALTWAELDANFTQLTSKLGASLVGFQQAGTGAVAETVQTELRQTVSVKQFGAKGDGATPDAAAFNAAAVYMNSVGGGDILVPFSATAYIIESTITLFPNVSFVGIGYSSSSLHFTGGNSTMFNFLGVSEAQSLNVTLKNLNCYSTTTATGTGLRVRNFFNIHLDKCTFSNFNIGAWADWGIGFFSSKSLYVLCNRGIQVGGGTGGIRLGLFGTSAFMDTVDIRGGGFSSNVVDINDMGSQNSLGGLIIEANYFFEGAAVTGRTLSTRICSRRAFSIKGNWFEEQQAGRVQININNYDFDGTLRDPPQGGEITANLFRVQGGATSEGIHVDRSTALTISNNDFWWGNAAGGYGINLNDTTSPVTVGPNNYEVYSGGSYTSNVKQATDYNLFVCPDATQRANAVNSFVTLPNGMIMQWGSVVFSSSATPTWTFPKPFPTRVLTAQCTPIQIGGTNSVLLNTDIISSAITTSVVFQLSGGAPIAINGTCFAIGY